MSFVPLLTLAVATLIYLFAYEPLLNGHERPIGSDYSEFLPRLLADHYWFRLNGLFNVPWFTPAFCGGMPDWANPQQMPYSVPQFLLWWVDPIRSVQVTFALFAIAGAVGMWLLLRRGFETSGEAATLGAVIFLFNGFYLAHLLVGHLPYHPFMLLPWVAWLVIRPRQGNRQLLWDALFAGIVLALMIQGGMLTILVPVGVAWVALGLMRGLTLPDPVGFWARLGGAIVVGGALCASKLVATSALASHFGRDFYKLSGFPSVGTTIAAAFRVLFLRAKSIDDLGYLHIVVHLPVHEGDYGVSLVPLVILGLGLLLARRSTAATSGRSVRWVLLGLILVLPLALNTFSPGWMQFLKHVPIIRQSSSLLRFFAVYIPVLAVGAALAADRMPGRAWVVGLGVLATVGWSVTADRSPYLEKTYHPMFVQQAWEAQKSGAPIPVVEKMDLKLYEGHPQTVVGADDAVTAGVSQVFCIDPIFGYFHEALPWRGLHDGPALDVTKGRFNVLNPTCELFPAENHCKPGDTFLESDRENAEAFLSWSPFPFQRSGLQRVADVVSLLSLVIVAALLLVRLAQLRQS